MNAEELKRKVQAGEDPSSGSESEDVTLTGDDMMETEAPEAAPAEETAGEPTEAAPEKTEISGHGLSVMKR